MTRVILVRHGQTDWNSARRLQGASDIPLNDTGREQARDAAERLATLLQDDVPEVVSSDLSRAAETADIIAARVGAAPVRRSTALRERSFGVAEGMLLADYVERWGSLHDADPPGAEPMSALTSRAIQGVSDAVAAARGDAPLVIVSHGAVIRAFIHSVTEGVHPREGERLGNGSLHSFHATEGHFRFVDSETITAPV